MIKSVDQDVLAAIRQEPKSVAEILRDLGGSDRSSIRSSLRRLLAAGKILAGEGYFIAKEETLAEYWARTID